MGHTAGDGSPRDEADHRHLGGVRPEGSTDAAQVEVDRDDAVTVTWSDGHVSRYSLAPLRASCTCATCRTARDAGRPVWPRPGMEATISVRSAELAGGWGLSIEWSDGHTTGIYAWDVLRAWCPCEECRGST